MKVNTGQDPISINHRGFLESILENTFDILWALSWPELEILYMSPSAGQFRNRIENLTQNRFEQWSAFVHPDDRGKLKAGLDELKLGGRTTCEFRAFRENGDLIWLKNRAHLVRDDTGHPVRIDGATEEITAEKKAQEALKQSEAKFLSLINTQTEMICRFLPDTTRLFVNEAYCRAMGKPAEELVGKKFLEMIPEDQHERILALQLELNRENPSITYEHRIQQPDGTETWQEWTDNAILDEKGRVVELMSVGRDITLQKRTMEMLERERRSLKNILEGTRAGTWEWNIQTGEVVRNERWAEIAGYTLEELEPSTLQTWEMLVHPDDYKAGTRQYREYIQGKRDYYDFELRIRHKKGYWIWVRERGKITEWTKTGEPLMMQGTILDISDQKKYAMKLERAHRREVASAKRAREMARRAEEASQTKNDFLANISHEIRTPLSIVMGFNELLNRTSLTKKQAKYVENMQRASQSLLDMINEILDYSKLETDRMALNPEYTDITRMAEEVIDLFGLMARQKNLRILLSVSETLPRQIWVDPVRLKQILMNLVSNAIKFTPTGEVHLEIRNRILKNQRISVTFRVRDTGIGIRPDDYSKLFKPFSQVDESTTRIHGGTGLGLAISSKLAEQMESRIDFKSRLGQGSSFFFTLRTTYRDKEMQESTDPALAGTMMEQEPLSFMQRKVRPRIMVVDDMGLNRELTVTLVKEMIPQVQVLEVSSGSEVLESFRSFHPHLIIMDLQMPGMSGLEATYAIRQINTPESRTTPIIALTAGAVPGEEQACYEAGMNGYLTKPIRSEKLMNVMISHLKETVFHQADDSVPDKIREGLLEKVMYNEDFLQKLVSRFEEDAAGLLDTMKKAAHSKERESLLRASHSLKGILNAFETDQACQLTNRIETQSRCGQFERAAETISQLEAYIYHLIVSLRRKAKPPVEIRDRETGNEN